MTNKTIIDLTSDPNIVALDFETAKFMAELLHKHYPDHLWGVTVQSDQGIATVRNLRLSGNWGFILKMKNIATRKELRRNTMMAGGELLERYRLSRGRFRAEEYLDLKVDYAGRILGDKG